MVTDMRNAPVNTPRLIQTYAVHPIRMWTVPVDDCVAFPTGLFYRDRLVSLSNEGNPLYPRWVALDRYNDENWREDHQFEARALSPIFDNIRGTKEWGMMRFEPTIVEPPPPRKAPLMRWIAYFLPNLVD
jgi:hypothetical protein